MKDPFGADVKVFADGSTTAGNHNLDASLSLFPSKWVTTLKRHGPTDTKWSAPTPSQLWLKERKQGAPWREEEESKLQIEDEHAKRELEKRALSILAKQTTSGLKLNFNVSFDTGDMIPLLEQGLEERDSANVETNLARLYKYAVRYDLRNVLKCLNLQPKNIPPPKLSLTRRGRPSKPHTTNK